MDTGRFDALHARKVQRAGGRKTIDKLEYVSVCERLGLRLGSVCTTDYNPRKPEGTTNPSRTLDILLTTTNPADQWKYEAGFDDIANDPRMRWAEFSTPRGVLRVPIHAFTEVAPAYLPFIVSGGQGYRFDIAP